MTVGTTSALLKAVEKTAHRVSLLMRAATHPDRNAVGTWSVAETANHLAHCYTSFIDAFEGTFSVAPEEVDPHNAEVLAADPERDLEALADRVDAGVQEYLAVARPIDEGELVDFFTGMRVPASAITATLLGEALVHGFDIARAEGLPWPIDPEHAILTLDNLAPVMVHFVDEDAATGFHAGFEIRLRDGSTNYWYFDESRLTVESSPVAPVACHISSDPATFLLMSYDRIGPIMPTLSGKVRVWGRRPWLANRLASLFKT